MHHDPASHDLRTIQLVAKGLTMVAGPQTAAQQLRRVYGERRAADALLAMAGPSYAITGRTARPLGARPTAGRPATYTAPARAPRRHLATRGHLQTDWL